MKGRTLDPSKPIMGGTQEGAALRSGIMKANSGAKLKSLVEDASIMHHQDLYLVIEKVTRNSLQKI